MPSGTEVIIQKIDKLMVEGAKLHKSAYGTSVDEVFFNVWVAEINKLIVDIFDKKNPYTELYFETEKNVREGIPRTSHVKTFIQILDRIKGEILENTIHIKKYSLELDQTSDFLPKILLHPEIEEKVRSAFVAGNYDTAIFLAFKEVEIAVRKYGKFQDTDLGTSLMRKAFRADNGPLTDKNLPISEREAIQHLFAGAIGHFKNPQSHRNVPIEDPLDAAEIIILASLLLKIVEMRGSQGN